ncbi:MAG: peroxiredoxin [Deltaproteobacteria bacterium]|nr:MAG: peroxiredoxin [Deltaproteobacteria bacterium]
MAVLVGKEAPDFTVTAVRGEETIENFTLSQFRGKKYVVLFFYPMDFTFVCPTELHEFQKQLESFRAIDAEIIGASVDSPHSHSAWLNMPKSQGGIQGVSYPIVADLTKSVAASYDVLLPEGIALRGTFIIDKEGVVQAQIIHNLALGRNVNETLRAVKALQFTERHGEVCPATWNEGAQGMQTTRDGLAKFFGG